MRVLSLILWVLLVSAPSAYGVTPLDADGDALLNTEEDKNGNGFVDLGETDPYNADTDNGGEADGAEIRAGRNPLYEQDDFTFDTDSDNLTTAEEAVIGTDPKNPDTDADTVVDGDDPFPLQNQYSKDTDGDGMPDLYETRNGFSVEDPKDASQDFDEDGLTNLEEFLSGTDPKSKDTDSDGVDDNTEVVEGTNPEESSCLLYSDVATIFDDIQKHWAKEYIEHMHRTKVIPDHTRIVQGYRQWDNGYLFRPDQPITRYELLKIALLSGCIALSDDEQRPKEFTDFPSAPRPNDSEDDILKRRVIYTATEKGIVEGYPDGTFKPDIPVNRAEALKMLLLATRFEPSKEYREGNYDRARVRFSDVPEHDWYSEHVRQAAYEYIVEGYGDGTYRPAQSITRAEATKIVYLLMINNPWVNGYVIPVIGI